MTVDETGVDETGVDETRVDLLLKSLFCSVLPCALRAGHTGWHLLDWGWRLEQNRMINSVIYKEAKKIFTTRLQAHDSLGGLVAGLDRVSIFHSCWYVETSIILSHARLLLSCLTILFVSWLLQQAKGCSISGKAGKGTLQLWSNGWHTSCLSLRLPWAHYPHSYKCSCHALLVSFN